MHKENLIAFPKNLGFSEENRPANHFSARGTEHPLTNADRIRYEIKIISEKIVQAEAQIAEKEALLTDIFELDEPVINDKAVTYRREKTALTRTLDELIKKRNALEKKQREFNS